MVTIWPSASVSSSSLMAVYGNNTKHCSLPEKSKFIVKVTVLIRLNVRSRSLMLPWI